MDDPLLDRITFSPDQCGGLPCIRGMRFRVLDVLQYMAGGETEDSLLAEFDFLERDDIRAALAYAALQVDHTVIATGKSGARDQGLLGRITFDADQCHGRPCLRGSRIRVQDVLDKLAHGWPVGEMLDEFPDLEADDVKAALAYAADYVGHPVIVSTAA